MTAYINTSVCQTDVTASHGDYFAMRIDLEQACPDITIDPTKYSYDASLWETTRAISEENPEGGIVLVHQVDSFNVEILTNPKAELILSLTASQTGALKPEVEYHWRLRWFTDPEGITSLSHGTFKVT